MLVTISKKRLQRSLRILTWDIRVKYASLQHPNNGKETALIPAGKIPSRSVIFHCLFPQSILSLGSEVVHSPMKSNLPPVLWQKAQCTLQAWGLVYDPSIILILIKFQMRFLKEKGGSSLEYIVKKAYDTKCAASN